jgi:hypothetical protein
LGQVRVQRLCHLRSFAFNQWNIDETVKSAVFVTPAKAGVQNLLKTLDCGLGRNDSNERFSTYYEIINIVCEI